MKHKIKLKQAVDLAVSKHNILLLATPSDRKPFIQQLVKQLPHNIMTCSIDLADIKNDLDVIERFYHAISATIDQNTINKAEANLIKLTEFFIEDNVPIHQQCSALIATYGFREVIASLFSALTTYCQTNSFSHVVVAIDNFENINTLKQLKLDATLRRISQHHQLVSFIFTGEATPLRAFFTRYKQPLFGSTTPIVLK